MSSLPSRKTKAAATSIVERWSVEAWSVEGGGTSAFLLRFTLQRSHAPRSPPHAFVNKPQSLHFRRVNESSAIEENWMGQEFAGAFEVELLEFRPFSGNDQGITAFSYRVHLSNVSDIRQHRSGFLHCAWIVNAQPRPLLQQTMTEFY